MSETLGILFSSAREVHEELARKRDDWRGKCVGTALMARCEVCGNDYDKAFSVKMIGHGVADRA